MPWSTEGPSGARIVGDFGGVSARFVEEMPEILNTIKGLQSLNRAREEKELEPSRSSLWDLAARTARAPCCET